MQLKNTPIFTPIKWNDVPGLIYKSRFIIAVVFAIVLLLCSCSKNPIAQAQQNFLEKYFEENILNRDFTVQLATDTSKDLTAQFSGYKFRLLKNTLLNGPMTAISGTDLYSGSWSCNDDYSKLVITLPSSVSTFSFLNREWKFTKKAVPVMELAPWGTTDPKVLHMERQ